MPSEFTLIDRYFTRPAPQAVLGVGDDAALLRVAAGCELVVSTDMLVAGTHFLPDTDPWGLGWKSLAVNVSDMAAMGAQGRWAVLALALPAADEAWIAAFAEGFLACASRFGIDLVGGDTTRGPLAITPTIFGEVPAGAALRRAGARAGDDVWVSGVPGLAALGLAHLQGRTRLPAAAAAVCVRALERPVPRVELGLALRGLASAAIDVSDGLLADLTHVLQASGVAARLQRGALPRSAELAACPQGDVTWQCQIGGGDDYELLFTAPPGARARIAALAATLDLPLSRIGAIEPGPPGALWLQHADGRSTPLAAAGYDHFA